MKYFIKLSIIVLNPSNKKVLIRQKLQLESKSKCIINVHVNIYNIINYYKDKHKFRFDVHQSCKV